MVNNWRRAKTVAGKGRSGVRRNRNDVTYDLYYEKVYAEVQALMGTEEEIDLSKPLAFLKRSMACKNVYAALSVQEQEEVQRLSLASNKAPNPAEIQQK